MSQGAMAEECRRPAFSGRIAPQHLAAPDLPRSDDSVGVPLTRDAHSWARLRLVADSDRRLRVAGRGRSARARNRAVVRPSRAGALGTANTVLRAHVRVGPGPRRGPPGYLSTGRVACSDEVECAPTLTRAVQVGF